MGPEALSCVDVMPISNATLSAMDICVERRRKYLEARTSFSPGLLQSWDNEGRDRKNVDGVI